MLSPVDHHHASVAYVGLDEPAELRFAVEGDAGMLVGAATTHAEVIRIVTHLRGPIREATADRLVIDHFGVRVTVRYHVPESSTLEWLAGREVSIELSHTARHDASDDGALTVQSLVVRDRAGAVLVSACDGDDAEPAGLDLAVRVVPDRRPGRTRLAFTSRDDGVVVPVGQDARLACDGRIYRVQAIRGGRRPAFFVAIA